MNNILNMVVDKKGAMLCGGQGTHGLHAQHVKTGVRVQLQDTAVSIKAE